MGTIPLPHQTPCCGALAAHWLSSVSTRSVVFEAPVNTRTLAAAAAVRTARIVALLALARCTAVAFGLSWFMSQVLNQKIAKPTLSARYEATKATPKQTQCKSDGHCACEFEIRREKVGIGGEGEDRGDGIETELDRNGR